MDENKKTDPAQYEKRVSSLSPIAFPFLLQKVGKHKDFILLTDTHPETSIAHTVLAESSIAAMKEMGVKHLCLEVPKEAQGDIDKYFKGEVPFKAIEDAYHRQFGMPWLSDEENKAHAELYLQMLKNSKESGIKVHYVDTLSPEPVAKENPYLATLHDKTIESTQGFSPERMEKYWEDLEKQHPNIKEDLSAFINTRHDQRFERDREIAAQMKVMAADGKVVLFYGAEHITRSGENYQKLLGDKAVSISMRKTVDASAGMPTEEVSADLTSYVFFTGIQTKSGVVQAAARLEDDTQKSDNCKTAVNASANFEDLLGCAVDDNQLRDYAASALNKPLPRVTKNADSVIKR